MEIRTEGNAHDGHDHTTHPGHDHARTTERQEWYHKTPPKWLLAPLLLLLVGATAAAIAHHDDRSAYDDRLPRAAVAHQGQVWLPQGNPVLLPDRRMAVVGNTVEGMDLYQVNMPQGGGGGPVAQPLVGTDQVFLRVGADQYQPLSLRRFDTNGGAIGAPRVGPARVGPKLVGPDRVGNE